MLQDNVLRLMILDRSSNAAEAMLNVLRTAGYGVRPRHIKDAENFEHWLERQPWDLILSAAEVGDLTIHDVLVALEQSEHDVPVIGIVDEADPAFQVEAMRAGARDVVVRKNHPHLLLTAERELANLNERRQRRRCELRYWESQRRCRTLLDSSREAIAYVHEGMHIHANSTYLQLYGYESSEELEGLPLLDMVADEDAVEFRRFIRQLGDTNGRQRMEIRCLRSDDSTFKAALAFSRAGFDGEDCFQVVVRDLSEEDAVREQISQLSERDQVTGLFNRQQFLESLERAISDAVDHGKHSSLLMVELENFRAIRRTVGVSGSDQVLADLARLVESRARDADMVARVGNLTFAALVDKQDPDHARALAEDIRKAVGEHITDVGGQSVAATSSIGVVPIGDLAANPQQILTDADSACRTAMERGGNQVLVFEHAAQPEEELSAAAELAAALEQDDLRLAYQPIVSLRGDTEEIYEVSVGIASDDGQHHDRRDAISQLEDMELVSRVDEWTLEAVVEAITEQVTRGNDVHFFVKLSDQSIRDESVLLHLSKLLRTAQLPANRLTFEVGEMTANSQVRMARAFVNGVKQLGCSAALRDFGAAINPFNALNHLDVDYLKIDPACIRGLASDPQCQEAVRTIRETAQSLGKSTIATAVTDANTLAVLWQCGISYAQGDYIQEPNTDLSYDFSGAQA